MHKSSEPSLDRSSTLPSSVPSSSAIGSQQADIATITATVAQLAEQLGEIGKSQVGANQRIQLALDTLDSLKSTIGALEGRVNRVEALEHQNSNILARLEALEHSQVASHHPQHPPSAEFPCSKLSMEPSFDGSFKRK